MTSVAACTTKVYEPVFYIPDDFFLCREPNLPPIPPTDNDIANYILDLYQTGYECRRKISSIKALYEAYKNDKPN